MSSLSDLNACNIILAKRMERERTIFAQQVTAILQRVATQHEDMTPIAYAHIGAELDRLFLDWYARYEGDEQGRFGMLITSECRRRWSLVAQRERESVLAATEDAPAARAVMTA